jgi:hypothetical protein
MGGTVVALLGAALLLGAAGPARGLDQGSSDGSTEDALAAVPGAGFRHLLELRMAAAPDLFDHDAFALLHHSLDIPGSSEACRETFVRLSEPAVRPALLAEARARLRARLARLQQEPPPRLVRITTRERLASYDPTDETFRLQAPGGNRPSLLGGEVTLVFAPPRHCPLGFHARKEPRGEAAEGLLAARLRVQGDRRLERLPLPLLDARDLLYRQVVLRGSREVWLDAVIETRASAEGVDGRVVMATAREPGTGLTLHRFDLDRPLAWPEQAAPPEAAPPPVVTGPDMLGIRVGMALDEAEALVRGHMAIGAAFADAGDRNGPPAARLFVANDLKEMIALHADPESSTTVAAAWRVLLFGEEAPEPAAVARRLEDKYGPPDWINPAGTGWAWGEGAGASLCRARRTAELSLEVAEHGAGDEGWVLGHVIDLLQAYRPVLALPEPAAEPASHAECGPTIEVRLEADGLLSFLIGHGADADAAPLDDAAAMDPGELLDLKL